MSDHLPTSIDTHPFLVRNWKGDVFQAEQVTVAWRRETRTVPRGAFSERQFVRWDHSQLDVATARGGRNETKQRAPLKADGRSDSGGEGDVVPNNGDGLRKVLRRIDPADALAINAVDNEIVELQERITHLRTQRKTLVTSAWRKGKPVLVHEVRPASDDEPRRYIGGTEEL